VAPYRERLNLPWWAWPAAVGAAVLAVTELVMGAPGLRHPLTFILPGLLAPLALYPLGRVRIQVDDTHLRVDDAALPLEVVSSVAVVDAPARRDLLGPEADPLAFVVQRPWISGGVRVDLADPADPTPYWFISSRRPERLAADLRTRGRTGQDLSGRSRWREAGRGLDAVDS
jgi:hypothetical protein